MQVRVLGCDGGIGDPLRTNALLVGDDILLDAGTGVGDLPLARLLTVDHVFITHAHMDHFADLPLLIDAVVTGRDRPVTVHATEETLRSFEDHIFNWTIWPDLRQIPTPDKPSLQFSPVEVGTTIDLGKCRITPVPANHTVSTVGFALEHDGASLVYCGDTRPCDALWAAVNAIETRYVLIETAFDDAHMRLAETAGHLCPTTLAAEIEKLQRPADIYINHMKPGLHEAIMGEIGRAVWNKTPQQLNRGQVLEL